MTVNEAMALLGVHNKPSLASRIGTHVTTVYKWGNIVPEDWEILIGKTAGKECETVERLPRVIIKPVKGATHVINGICYKKGAHGFTYYWSKQLGEWCKDNRNVKLSNCYKVG